MAKKEETKKSATTGATKDTSKNSSAGKKRSTAQLTGEKGNIIRVIRGAASLANTKNREGLGISEGKSGKDGAKNLAGRLNSVVKPNGKIDIMETGSENYKSLLDFAKKALPSLKSSSYDANVKNLLKFVLENLNSGTGGGKKGFNPGALSDISF